MSVATETDIEHPFGAKCSSRAADRVIAELAEAQHGVVARRQLLAATVSRRQIGVRLNRGSIHPIHFGVYAVGHRQISLEGKWTAAVLACGPGAVLSHRSAAQLWGLLSRSSGFPEVTRLGGYRGRAGIVMHHSLLPADERTVVDGIPVTTVPRTIFDLAGGGDRRHVERALHEAEVQHLTDRLSIPDLLERYPGRAGATLLRELVSVGVENGFTANDLESLFAELIERHGLPRPRFNADLFVGGRHFRPDCVWAEHRVVVELDGGAVHGTSKAFEADRERDRIFVANGWRVVRVTWRQLTANPKPLVRDLRCVLGASPAFASI